MFVVVFLFWIISNFFVIIFRALMVAVASAAGDETLLFWNVFGTPGMSKPKAYPEPFVHVSRIR